MPLASRLTQFLGRWTAAASLCLSVAVWAQQGPPAAPVEVAEAQVRALAPVIWVAGTVTSLDDANIAAEVAGRLVTVADEGDPLERNDVLARLDDTLFKADVAEARAAVASEQANLTFLRREVDRLQRLARQNNAAQTQLEQTLAQRDASQNNLEAARARLQIAQERLARTVLRAPFAGVVVRRAKRAGEWVNGGDAVLQLVDTERLEIETTAPVALRPFLSLGQRLKIKTDRQQGTATLRAVVPVADVQSRLLRLRLEIAGGEWLAGQPVKVALPTAQPQEVLSVPRDALVLRRGGSYLFKVNTDTTAEQVFVDVGIADGEFIQVGGNLDAGDRVVIRGNERLRPGQPVRVKDGAAQ
ncbi:hypothetical protein Tel_02560 [Candidatus Tenderia electrophaga]|jgi:RND family efflux transporter MFP subunit|uniref:RND efflux pump membrane fusion protein barrel-sandwich domain-containing protein n=1 Tax=Candidatus Tenderia electrophaga TaxID=1748243 RepID=A0A0S2TAC9_9GAMM|nr:hypothetical protein Tel_02560 [Candidatus Tenderia electrophaga]